MVPGCSTIRLSDLRCGWTTLTAVIEIAGADGPDGVADWPQPTEVSSPTARALRQILRALRLSDMSSPRVKLLRVRYEVAAFGIGRRKRNGFGRTAAHAQGEY